MPFTADLHLEGYKPGTDTTTAQVYVHGDTDDPFAARQALLSTLDYTLPNGHFFKDATLGAMIGFQDGEYWWCADCTWGLNQTAPGPDAPEGTPPVLKFSTKGRTQHITQSLETVGSYAPIPRVAADHKGAIGVTKNGIEGVSTPVPGFSWSLTLRVDASLVTDSYVQDLENLTGSVNNATYRGRPAGSVRFAGADGQRQGDEFEIQFDFESEQNVEDRTVGDITGIDKDGWDYLWVQYEEQEDNDSNSIASRPISAYGERVSPRADFALLGV